MSAAKVLRQRLAEPTTHFVPACYDAMSARMIRDAGYPLTFLSGYQVSATRLGLPDTGYLTLTEMTSQVRDVTTRLPGFPVIVDADTGYGNAMNVRRTVLELGKAGAAGLLIEDQVMPKRCGHIGAKAVISRPEAVAKIRAAADAREESGDDIVILARTDSRRLLGFDEAMQRCREFQAVGADIVFMEALQDVDEMKAFVSAMDVPTLGNNSRGSETYMRYLDRQILREIGFRIVIDPSLLYSVASAIRTHLTAHKADEESAYPPQVSFSELNEIVGLPALNDIERRYSE
ncbi:isocitrate lyase/PEP mutase family protein [Paraburkholderia sp.]|uniref:isocitrate lyase/PEP mutase family protein n=1 Tax=Paraburkholderia sp. TaxID=1926495 RepID=UPI003D6E1DD7